MTETGRRQQSLGADTHNLVGGRSQARTAVGRYLHFQIAIDNNLVASERDWPQRLVKLGEVGWIDRLAADVIITEASAPTDETTRRRLTSDLVGTIILGGPHVDGHSADGYSVPGTPADDARLRRVYQLVFPHRSPDSDRVSTSRAIRGFYRDAMHISVAVRSCVDAFVTLDRRIVDASPALQGEYGLVVYTPAGCVMKLAGFIQSVRHIARPGDAPLFPTWPTDPEMAAWASEGEDSVGDIDVSTPGRAAGP